MKNWIFGYGSLVNEKTRKNESESVNVSLMGWRRSWGHHAVLKDTIVCGLTILPDENTSIYGVILSANELNFDEIDEREIDYRRKTLEHGIKAFDREIPRQPSSVDVIHTYISETSETQLSSYDAPILQTYLDVIFDGFEREFGPESLKEFIKTTSNWDRPILDDRKKPIYPRALEIAKGDLERYDQLIADCL